MVFVDFCCTLIFYVVHACTTPVKINDLSTCNNMILKKGQQEAAMFPLHNDRNNHDATSQIITRII